MRARGILLWVVAATLGWFAGCGGESDAGQDGCPAGLTSCGDSCVDTDFNPAHCGGCANACGSGELCSVGTCAAECLGGTTQCGDRCVDTAVDPAHCGGCDQACGPDELCSQGACGASCSGTTSNCGGLCVDTGSDPDNCGGCGQACAPGEICTQGSCGGQCGGGTTACNGSCVDTSVDPAHCGSCDQACGTGAICSGGACKLLCGLNPCTQAEHMWSKRLGGASNDYLQRAVIDSSGNIYAVGHFQGVVDFGGGPIGGATSYSLLVMKLGSNGNPIWSKAFGNTEARGYDVAIDSGGNVLVSGIYQGVLDFGPGPISSAGSWDGFVAKLDSSGNGLWSKGFGDINDNRAQFVATDPSGNVLLTGFYQGTIDLGGGPHTSAGSWDGFVAKLSPGGSLLWELHFGDAFDQRARGLAVDAAGNVLLASYFQGSMTLGGGTLISAGEWDSYVAKLDPDGGHLWSKSFGSPDPNQYILDAAVDGAGNLLVGGYFQGSWDLGGGPLDSAGSYDAFIAAFDPSGNHLYSKRFGDVDDDRFYSVAVDAGGNLAVSGHYQGSIDLGGGPLGGAGGWDALVARFDASGNYLWAKRFGDGAGQVGMGTATTTSGAVLTVGYFAGAIDLGGGPLLSVAGDDIYLGMLAP